MMIEHIVFYGTLKSDQDAPIHKATREKLKYAGQCRIPGTLYNKGRYPALMPGDGEVEGELYKIIDPAVLPVLDDFESKDDENPELPGFSRKPAELIEPKVQAWAYYYDGHVSPEELIGSGRWN